jgi:hypothetical protein
VIIRDDGTATFQADFTSVGSGDVWLLWLVLMQGRIEAWHVEQHDSDTYPGVGVTPVSFGFTYAPAWFPYITGFRMYNHC